jgi:DUF4097 and DUF4098 domain-containing protein YvlB
MRKRETLALLCAFLIASAAGAQVGSGQELVVPLSNSGQPVVLEVSLIQGAISVTGYEGSQVLVSYTIEESSDAEEEVEQVDGMMRIPDSSVGLTIEEKDNLVEIGTDWSAQEVNLKVRVPVQTSLRINCVNGGEMSVSGVSGTHELSHTNAGIKAVDIRGSVVADTTNGDLVVEFLEMDPDTPMSFSSFNGDVDITFPATLKADLRMRSGQGDIFSDFQVQLQPVEATVTTEEHGGGYHLRMEREVRGTIGGGGPEMTFKTFNGNVYLRKLGG